MKYSEENIFDFLKETVGAEQITADSDICGDLEVDGDDFAEMIEEYSAKFSVDMSGYLWYFHMVEEGALSMNIGALFFDPPYRGVSRISITPQMLTEFANAGRWNIAYPEHKVPSRRYDVYINQAIFLCVLVGVVVWVSNKYILDK